MKSEEGYAGMGCGEPLLGCDSGSGSSIGGDNDSSEAGGSCPGCDGDGCVNSGDRCVCVEC